MPQETIRTSLAMNLEERYQSQKVGEAFNAKLAGGSTIEPSLAAKLFEDSTAFDIKQQQCQTNMKGISDGGTYKELSRYANNINVTPYKK
jgi:hypothetical protein